jgi:hypothetical protein
MSLALLIFHILYFTNDKSFSNTFKQRMTLSNLRAYLCWRLLEGQDLLKRLLKNTGK